MSCAYAPGMRVEVRDAEWRIRRVDAASDGGEVITCEGLSQLVQGREALFLTRLENVLILDPVDTALVDDTSSQFGASLLYLDSMLRKTAPSDNRIHLGHRAAVDELPFQLEPTLQALRQPRQRILIADSVGLGKTLEAAMLTSELIARGRGKRILVLAVKSMLTQFQQEFWTRFTIPLTRLDSSGLQRVRNQIPTNHNPFHYIDRAIISIDTLKQDIEYRHHLEQAYWDIIIIDEAHNVAERGSHSQRARLAKLLATRSDTLIMLSATPHDGKAESFASLVNMLDPTAIADPSDYAEEDFRDKGLVIRRFKKDVRDQLRGNFPEREIRVLQVPASAPEEEAFSRLAEVQFHTLDGRTGGIGQLFRTTLEKALFSSPAACLSSVQNRMQRLQKQIERVRDDEVRTTLLEDYDALEGLAFALKAITPEYFSKYQLLLEQLRGDLGWKPNKADDRLVIFTESLQTLAFLKQHLPKALGLKAGAVAELNGGMTDRDLMETVEAFNQREKPIRLLLCSDVAAEGINLHHLSHRMIHFDIPWSLMVFQQRNGRIDRYGQTHTPQIRYLQAISQHVSIRGDQRVLEILVEKDEQAGKNIGDPSEFLGLYDRDAEENKIAEVMEQAEDDDLLAGFESLMNQQLDNSESPLASFIPDTPQVSDEQKFGPLHRVFPNGLEYARAAIRWFKESGQKLQAQVENQVFAIHAPSELRERLKFLPAQARPDHDEYQLTIDKDLVNKEIQRTRQSEESAWPRIHYLWPIHPIMEWLSDRALNAFGRHTAPVLRMAGQLQTDEHIVLLYGGYPNRRGHILVQDWLGVRIQRNQVVEQLDWPSLQARLSLRPASLPNPGRIGDTESFKALLPIAVESGYRHLADLKTRFEAERQPALAAQQQRLDELRARHEQQLELDLARSAAAESIKQRQRSERQAHIERVFQDYQDWLTNTQTTEDTPYLQVAAVFTGQEA